MSREARHLLIVVAVASTVLFTNLGGPRLWDRDEPRNAGCAVEMLQRGDWVVPWFNDELRSHKPVLLYWLMMTAYSVFGVNEFAARFWSAALGVGSVVGTYLMGRRLFDSRVGAWAGVILATTLMFDVAGRAATPDSVLIFCCVAAMTCFVYGVVSRADATATPGSSSTISVRTEMPWRTAVVVNICLGFAVLAKGPVGLILPTAIMGMFFLLIRIEPAAVASQTPATNKSRWRQLLATMLRPFAPLHFLRTCWAMRPFTALTCCAAVALPWYVWVGLRTDGEFLRGFFWDHNFQRATQSFEGHRGPGLVYYPVAILAGFFPWSVFFGPGLIEAVSRLRRSTRENVGLTFAFCWIGVWVVAFSLAKTKLPSYVTPCYPALALAVALFVERWLARDVTVSIRWMHSALITVSIVGVALLIALPLVARRFLPGDEWLAIVGVPLLVSGGSGLWLLGTDRRRAAVGVFATGALAFTTGMFAFAMDRVDSHQQSHVLLQAIQQRSAHAEVAWYGCLEPSWVFYGGWPIRELRLQTPQDSAAETVVNQPFAPNPPLDLARFLNSPDERFIITVERQLPQLREHLPADVTVIATAQRFLKKDRLVVLTRQRTAQLTAAPRATSR